MREIKGTLVLDTLEEIADPKHMALVLIDIQNGFTSGKDASWLGKILPNTKKVLEEARQLGLLIIFIKFARPRDGSFNTGSYLNMYASEKLAQKPVDDRFIFEEGNWGFEVVDELAPVPGPNELQITKYRSSAFIGTPLDMLLRSKAIKSAAVVGLVTEGCVETTVRDLNQYGYYPVVLSDCVVSGHQNLHEAALLVMSARYNVTTSDELLRLWHSASVTREDQPIGKAGTRLESGATR